MKLKVRFLTNFLVVKIEQAARVNVPIKSDCSISLLVVIPLRVKIEHVFEFTDLCNTVSANGVHELSA